MLVQILPVTSQQIATCACCVGILLLTVCAFSVLLLQYLATDRRYIRCKHGVQPCNDQSVNFFDACLLLLFNISKQYLTMIDCVVLICTWAGQIVRFGFIGFVNLEIYSNLINTV